MSESNLGASARRVRHLEAEAKQTRERFDAERAKAMHSPHASRSALRKLQEDCRYAEARLKRAKAQ
jgi:hypothetical protein